MRASAPSLSYVLSLGAWLMMTPPLEERAEAVAIAGDLDAEIVDVLGYPYVWTATLFGLCKSVEALDAAIANARERRFYHRAAEVEDDGL